MRTTDLKAKDLKTKLMTAILAMAMSIVWSAAPMLAQSEPPAANQDSQNTPPPSYSPEQLDQMVSRIALYPDPLLAQVLAAATFPDDIPDAAKWADDHHYLRGDDLANAIKADQLPWDPSVQALLPFPSVLDMMASDIDWTRNLGDAFLAQHDDVMNAVQRMRQKAKDYGYLASNSEVVVGGGPYITIDPVDPAFVWVPAYDPAIVFFAPRPGFFVGGAIGWGFGINIGVWFRPWGWGWTSFNWGAHVVILAGHPWGRVWGNRFVYVHPWGPGVQRWAAANRAEGHRLIPRDQAERRAAREGRARPEERHHR
jgi:hypothetical protein